MSSGADIRKDTLLRAPVEAIERLARFMRIELPTLHEPTSHGYHDRLADRVARWTDSRYFQR